MCWMSTPLDTLCLQVTCAFLHGHTHTHNDPYFLLGGRVLYNKRNINNDLFFFLSFGALLFFIWFYLSADEREREIMGVVGTVTRTHLDTTPIWSAAVVKTISAGVVPIISRQSHLINYRTVRLPITHLRPSPSSYSRPILDISFAAIKESNKGRSIFCVRRVYYLNYARTDRTGPGPGVSWLNSI